MRVSESDAPEARLGLPVSTARIASSCPQCHGTGYLGRTLVAEMLSMDMGDVAAAVLSRSDMVKLEQSALRGGMVSRWHCAPAGG